jgi:Fe-S-cluster-containing hydrogenase component 2
MKTYSEAAMKNIFGQDENADTKKYEGKTLRVITSRCPQNHPCPSVKVCPVGALSQKGYNAPVIDKNKCIKCGKCVKFCPMKALVME